MSWTLPTPLLLFAGVVAVLPLTALVRWPTTLPRLVAQAVGATRAVIARFWLAGTRRVFARWGRAPHRSSPATGADVRGQLALSHRRERIVSFGYRRSSPRP